MMDVAKSLLAAETVVQCVLFKKAISWSVTYETVPSYRVLFLRYPFDGYFRQRGLCCSNL